jgi:hypothetical protein
MKLYVDSFHDMIDGIVPDAERNEDFNFIPHLPHIVMATLTHRRRGHN